MPECRRVTPEWDELALEIGKFMRYWGFKVIHGRIWTHIYLSAKPIDAGCLMERFGLSKALMSLSLNDLLRHEVILEAGKSEKGTQTYKANPEIVSIILGVLKRREKKMLTQIQHAQSLLASLSEDKFQETALDKKRLEELGHLITHAQEVLDCILDLSKIDLDSLKFFSAKT